MKIDHLLLCNYTKNSYKKVEKHDLLQESNGIAPRFPSPMLHCSVTLIQKDIYFVSKLL